MRLIDADELKPDVKTFTSIYSEELIPFYSQDVIDKATTVDAMPIRHGKWLFKVLDGWVPDYNCVCSECNESGVPDDNYCRNCGAKMDKEGISNEKRM